MFPEKLLQQGVVLSWIPAEDAKEMCNLQITHGGVPDERVDVKSLLC
jgi:hypothetical protein